MVIFNDVSKYLVVLICISQSLVISCALRYLNAFFEKNVHLGLWPIFLLYFIFIEPHVLFAHFADELLADIFACKLIFSILRL